MTSLKMTQARLDLLQAIDDGAVEELYPILPNAPYTVHDRGPGFGPPRWRTVTRAVEDLRTAGLVKLAAREPGAHYRDPRVWELTEAGRAILRRSE